MNKKTPKTKRAARRCAPLTRSATGLDFAAILKRADSLYCAEKTKHIRPQVMAYWAPEMFPRIASNQLKAVLQALVEALNAERKSPNGELSDRASKT